MNKKGVYIKELTVENVKCFKETHQISFVKPNGEPYQWNVILGNNNTGKSTILKAIASLEPIWDIEYFTANITIFNEIKNNFNISLQFLHNNFTFDFRGGSVKGLNENGLRISSMKTPKNEPDVVNSLKNCFFVGYGISRKISESTLSNGEQKKNENLKGIFQDDERYTNPEEWLFQLELVAAKGDKNSKKLLEKVKKLLSDGLLPDVFDVELISETKDNTAQNYALFHTDYGKVRLRELGYGYQSTMIWVVDLAKKMFEHFYQLENPLHGSAIVLVDEIDLHLHPDWQRKIMKHLSGVFPNVQFIVTAHSPLIVQSADDVNLIILEKNDENIHIRQEFGTFQGWTVEEILQDLMGLGEKTLSDNFLNHLKVFEDGVDEENYKKAKYAYDELLKILHPTSSQRKLLKLQLGSIAPTTSLAYA